MHTSKANLKTKEETLRTKERIRARAAQRHKARDKALPVGQRPVKWLRFMTVVLSGNLLLALFTTWRHRFVLLGLLHHVPSTGSISFHDQTWDVLGVLNVFMFSAALISMWTRIFQAQAQRRRVKEQRRATRALGGAGIWPPPPRA